MLFIRLNRIGDALVVTPLFHIVKENLGCQIDILADKKNYFIFENNKFIDNVLTFAKGINGFLSKLKKINKLNCDAVIDLHDDISTTVSFLIVLSKSRYKIGMNKGNEKIYTHTIKKLNSTEHHVIDRIMEFSKLFNISFSSNDINIEYYPNCDVAIYNRYGYQLYTATPYNNDWDGKYNGTDLPDVTYYYVMKCPGTSDIFKGAITIFRRK